MKRTIEINRRLEELLGTGGCQALSTVGRKRSYEPGTQDQG